MTENVCFNVCLFIRESDWISHLQTEQNLDQDVHIKISIEKYPERYHAYHK